MHTQSGYEKKVKSNLEARIQSMNREDTIFEVVIPMEDVVEFKNGARSSSRRRSSPATCSSGACMTDDTWYVIRNTPGRHRVRRPERPVRQAPDAAHPP